MEARRGRDMSRTATTQRVNAALLIALPIPGLAQAAAADITTQITMPFVFRKGEGKRRASGFKLVLILVFVFPFLDSTLTVTAATLHRLSTPY